MPRKKKEPKPVLTPLQKQIENRGIRLLGVQTVNVTDERWLQRHEYRTLHVAKVAADGYSPVFLSLMSYIPPDNVEVAVGLAFDGTLMWKNYDALYRLFGWHFGDVADYMQVILDNKITPWLDESATAYEERDTSVPW